MLSYGADGALLEKVPVYATALIIHVPMLSCTWLKENIFNVGYMEGNTFYFLVVYYTLCPRMVHPNTQKVKHVRMPSWMNKELLTELRHPKEAHKWWQHRKVA